MAKIRFTSYVEEELKDLLKQLSIETRVPESRYVQEAIEDLLRKYNKLPADK